MTLNLGQTTDPVMLIPGSAADLEDAVRSWRAHATIAEETAARLRKAREVEEWTGGAADAYELKMSNEARSWSDLSDAFTMAATALVEFASTLTWAQRQAAVSIEKWEQGQRSAFATGIWDPSSAVVSPGQVPGETEAQREAREILSDARDRVRAAGDQAAAVLNAIGEAPGADQAVWSVLRTPPTTAAQVASLLAGLNVAEIAALLKAKPSLATLLSAQPATQIAPWWKSLSTSQQNALITAIPRVIGNLEGVPYSTRDQANRIALAADIAAAEQELKDSQAIFDKYRAGRVDHTAADRFKAAQEQLTALQAIAAVLTPPPGRAARELITLTADHPPLAAVSLGSMDAADSITYAVPGMGTTTAGMKDWALSAQYLADLQDQHDSSHSHAVVAWIGYKTPPVPLQQGGFDVMGVADAQAGAEKLDAALTGVAATRSGYPPQVNVVAHSYGTTTAALALTRQDIHVNSFVSVGSAGLPPQIDHASDIHADQVFAGQAQDVWAIDPAKGDQWAWTGRLSPEHPVNPIGSDFGAHNFSVDGHSGGAPVTDHAAHTSTGNGYLDFGTESLKNIALATTGQGNQVSAYIPPAPTPFQQAIIDGATYGYGATYGW